MLNYSCTQWKHVSCMLPPSPCFTAQRGTRSRMHHRGPTGLAPSFPFPFPTTSPIPSPSSASGRGTFAASTLSISSFNPSTPMVPPSASNWGMGEGWAETGGWFGWDSISRMAAWADCHASRFYHRQSACPSSQEGDDRPDDTIPDEHSTAEWSSVGDPRPFAVGTGQGPPVAWSRRTSSLAPTPGANLPAAKRKRVRDP